MMRRNSIKFLQTFFCCSRVEDCFSSNEIQNFFSNPKDSYLRPALLPISDSILTKWVTATIANTKQKSLKFGTVENGTKGAAEFVCQMTSKLGRKKFLWIRKRGHGGFGGLPVVFLGHFHHFKATNSDWINALLLLRPSGILFQSLAWPAWQACAHLRWAARTF